MRARVGFTAPFSEPKIAPAVRLPSTQQIDARIRRQTTKFRIWRTQYLRLKCDGGRTQRGPRPTKPPGPVALTVAEDGTTLVFSRAPERRHPEGTEWIVPCAGVHPTHGPCYYLDSLMVMNQQLLRTVPSRRLLVVRGPTPADSPVFKALQQEWVRIPSDRGTPHARRRRGYHRWLCCLVERPR